MSNQPKLLLAIYALLGVLAIIFALLLWVNPFNFESTLSSTQTANIVAQAETLRNKGENAEAEKLCLNALKKLEAADDIQKAKVYHALGLTYFAEKKFDEAQDSYRKALAFLEQLLNQEGAHRLTLENLRLAEHLNAAIECDLADLLVNLSKYAEAETLYKSALEKNDQYLGTIDMQRRISSKLSEVLPKLGKNSEAEDIQVEAYSSDYSSKDLMSEIKRVQAEFESKKIESAQQITQLKALALTAKRKGRDVPYVDAKTALAKATMEAGDPTKAKKLLVPVFSFVENAHYDKETEAIWLSRARVTQAACCLALHENKEAETLLTEAGAVNPKLLFAVLQFHLNTASAREVGLKDYYRLLVDLSQKAHLESYPKKKLKVESIDELANLYNQLGIAYVSFDQVDKAERCYKLGLDLAKQAKNIGRQAELYTRLGRAAVLQKNYAEAEQYYDKSTALQSSIKAPTKQAAQLINQAISENYAEVAAMYNAMKNNSKTQLNYKLAYDKDMKSHNWVGIYSYAQYMQVRGDCKGARAAYEAALNNLKSSQNPSKVYVEIIENRLKRLPVVANDPAIDALVKQGDNLLDDHKTAAGREVLQKAESATIAKFGKESVASAEVYREIANYYMNFQMTTDALPLYRHALEIAQKNKVQLPRINYKKYCTCLSQDSDKSKTIDNAKQIISVLSPVVVEIEADPDPLDKLYLSAAYLLLGEAYSTQKMYTQAQDYLNKSVSSAEYQVSVSRGEKTNGTLADALKARAQNDSKLKKYNDAIAGYKRAIEIWEKIKSDPIVTAKLADTRILLSDTTAEAKKL
ncbi:MAG: tetratricopeptide repeat protein [Cyanobacteria bacterium SZAS-4]|nr:tetratricopeptide repeat protein [Cyanobacteria bacterium SZAS-4]